MACEVAPSASAPASSHALYMCALAKRWCAVKSSRGKLGGKKPSRGAAALNSPRVKKRV
jgi:hypothetical protein